MQQTNKKKFKANLTNLREIRNLTYNFAKSEGFDNMDINRIEMAVDEACANIILHTYKNDTSKPIYITFKKNDDSISIVIEDEGERFDPQLESLPDLKKHAQEYRTNGLGIYLMTRLVDEIHYEYIRDKGNRLKLVKYRIIEELIPL